MTRHLPFLLLLCVVCSAQNIMPPTINSPSTDSKLILQSPRASAASIPGTQAMALPIAPVEYVHALMWQPGFDCIVEQSSNLTDWQEVKRFQVQVVCLVTNTEPSMCWRVANECHGTNEPMSSFITITN